MDYFGRGDGTINVDEPWNGFTQALVRARVPSVPVHIDDITGESGELGLKLLILPNLAVLSDDQVAAVEAFLAGGGSLIATGLSSLCDGLGELRPDFALAGRFGVHVPARHGFRDEAMRTGWARDSLQTYLRLSPELRARFDGPLTGDEPQPAGERHPVLGGLDETDILGFGGMLEPLVVDPGATVPFTFVPEMPNMPVEAAWMRVSRTDIPGLVLRETPEGGRIAYMPADLDRRFSRDNQPDHGDVLANLVRWAVADDLPLRVEGPGLIDTHLYVQEGRLVLHVINLTSAGTWRAPVHELIPVGPLKVEVRLPAGVARGSVRSLVSRKALAVDVSDGWARFQVGPIMDHDVVVVE